MIPVLALLVGAALGFVGSRRLRRTSGYHAPPRLRQPRSARPLPPARSEVQRPFPLAPTPRATVPRSAPPATLSLVRRDTRERMALGSDPLSIGRSGERDLTIDDDRVSRSHAHLERRGSGWYVVDDGSVNGTTVNRAKLAVGQPRQIHVGDRIGIGPFDLDVVADEERRDRTPGPGS